MFIYILLTHSVSPISVNLSVTDNNERKMDGKLLHFLFKMSIEVDYWKQKLFEALGAKENAYK